MPYTKRIPHYGSPKELLQYILDEKHDGEKVSVESSINCNVETALSEFLRVQERYNMQGNRVAYHIIQSFSPKDVISAPYLHTFSTRKTFSQVLVPTLLPEKP